MRKKAIVIGGLTAIVFLLILAMSGSSSLQAESCFDTCSPTCSNWECRPIGRNGSYCFPLGSTGNPCQCCDDLFAGSCDTDNGQCGV